MPKKGSKIKKESEPMEINEEAIESAKIDLFSKKKTPKKEAIYMPSKFIDKILLTKGGEE